MPSLSSILWALTGLAIGYVILKVGYGMLRSFGHPIVPVPEPGELRRVNIRFRCSVCGMEIKMVLANDDLPEPPKHCLEEMDLVAPIE